MRYGHLEQEERYQRLRTLGKPVDHAGASFEHFALRPFLEQVLPQLTFAAKPPRVLEYGTGTGPGACFLAARGFQVDAIDIAPTAIALARQFAAEQGLEITFAVQDIGNFRSPGLPYQLVVDNYCLQRLVTDESRQQAFAMVRSILQPHGYYIIGTTIYRPGRELPADECCDEQTGIVYRKLTADAAGFEDVVKKNGELWYPRVRRVRPEVLPAELTRAGFRVLWQEEGRVLCQFNDPGREAAPA